MNNRIELVTLLPQGAKVAEIGVAEGLFSKDLLDAGVALLYSVDNWAHIPNVTGDGNFDQKFHDKNYDAAVKRLAEFGDRSVMLKGLSVDMANLIPDNSLDMVYFDAGHYYGAVVADLIAWYPKVRSGGIIAGHDYLNPDYQVKEAVSHFIRTVGIITAVNVIPENNIEDASFYFVKP